jgi:holo-[acyl-carrier protein] synthase
VIVGVGQDLVHVPRLARIVERWDRRFLDRCFSAEEQTYCLRYRDPAPHFAARFAAKEAFYKALSRGRPMGIWFLDAEVVRGPSLVFSSRADRLVREERLTQVHLTMTHDGEYASAVVVLER